MTFSEQEICTIDSALTQYLYFLKWERDRVERQQICELRDRFRGNVKAQPSYAAVVQAEAVDSHPAEPNSGTRAA
jgi:hypothetical protein